MKQRQGGFTLIELVVVIVLLGILGVTALGRFQNLSANAADATEDGIASELSAAAAVNFAASQIGTVGATVINSADCHTTGAPSATLDALMQSGAAPTADITYGFDSGDVAEGVACTAGQTYVCSVSHASGTGASDGLATIICTG